MAKKATTEAHKRRAPKPKQGFIPGMEPPSIPEIDEAADELASIRGQRMQLTQAEVKAADALLILMHQHKLKAYDYGEGRRVEVASLEKVKVKRQKEESNGDGQEED